MEPQIIDYYNEMPSGVNVIEKMNKELAQVQKENDELKKQLDVFKKREERDKDPVVIYKDQEELDRVKEEAYSEFYSDLRNVSFDPHCIHPHLMIAIEILLHNLLKDKERKSPWPYGKSGDIQDYIEATIEPLDNNGYLDYDLIFDIIKNYIEKMFNPDVYGIVKFICEKCNELDYYLEEGLCYGCRYPESDD
jgi:hypothetical protein